MVKNKIKNNYGFSIVELLVACGLFGIIMLASYGIFSVSNVMWQNMSAKIYVQEECLRGFQAMMRELETSNSATVKLQNSQGSLEIDGSSHRNVKTSIIFQEPVEDPPGTGIVDNHNYIKWGAIDNSGAHHLNWTVEFIVDSATNRLVRRVYDSDGIKWGADRVLANDVVNLPPESRLGYPAYSSDTLVPFWLMGYGQGGTVDYISDYPESIAFRLSCCRKVWPQFSDTKQVWSTLSGRVYFRD